MARTRLDAVAMLMLEAVGAVVELLLPCPLLPLPSSSFSFLFSLLSFLFSSH